MGDVCLDVGVSLFSGAWMLVLGISDSSFSTATGLATLSRMRILSGIQPSGALHLGNYFGMMRPAIELQEKGEAFYFIADYHSMTSLFDANERRKNTLDVALDFLACGLDPRGQCFFANPMCRKSASCRGCFRR
jgi:tryptophanyl-tRNA synthetase